MKMHVNPGLEKIIGENPAPVGAVYKFVGKLFIPVYGDKLLYNMAKDSARAEPEKNFEYWAFSAMLMLGKYVAYYAVLSELLK